MLSRSHIILVMQQRAYNFWPLNGYRVTVVNTCYSAISCGWWSTLQRPMSVSSRHTSHYLFLVHLLRYCPYQLYLEQQSPEGRIFTELYIIPIAPCWNHTAKGGKQWKKSRMGSETELFKLKRKSCHFHSNWTALGRSFANRSIDLSHLSPRCRWAFHQ